MERAALHCLYLALTPWTMRALESQALSESFDKVWSRVFGQRRRAAAVVLAPPRPFPEAAE